MHTTRNAVWTGVAGGLHGSRVPWRALRCLAVPGRLAGPVMLAALLVAPTTAAGPTAQAESDLDGIFAAWNDPRTPGCAVSVTRDGTELVSAGYGSANLEYSIPITSSTVFHVASVSKQFTALAVQLLVDDGRLSWDDDVRDHVPELAGLGQRISLRQLGHHTSGLRDQWSLLRMAGWRFEGDVVTQADVLGLLSRQRALNFEPGSGYLYSNSGYTLLATVVERVSGQSLRQFAHTRIFEPLGMRQTHFHDDHRMIVPGRAYAYARTGASGYRLSIPDFATIGATSLFTTLDDLALWNRNLDTGTVGGRRGIEQLLDVGTLNDGRRTSYALGLARGRHRGLHTVGHGGTDSGYRAELLRFPEQRLAIAVLCNVGDTDPARLARLVADLYLELPEVAAGPEVPSRATTAPASPPGPGARAPSPSAPRPDLTALTGYYRREASDVPLHLVTRGDRLTTVGRLRPVTLHPVDARTFRVSGSSHTRAELLDPTGGAEDRPVRLRLHDPAGPGDTYVRSRPWRPTATELAPLAGAYESAELDVVYRFVVEQGRLVLRHRKLGVIRLVPTYGDGFYGEGLYLSFARDPDGRGAGFTASTPRAWKVAFTRLPANRQ